MAGGALIIAGAAIVSWRGGAFKLRLAALMLACGLVLALATLVFKIFALQVEFWTATFWLFTGETLFGAVLLLIAPYRRQLAAVLRANTAGLLSINASNELINLGGGVANRYALLLAPISLVQAIGSTTTLFVFIFGALLSVLFPPLSSEGPVRARTDRKGIAAVLVAIGVAVVTR